MNPDLDAELERLQQLIAELAETSRRALGFAHTVEYRGLTFLISPRMVAADVSPLGFLQMTEAVEDEHGEYLEQAEAAVRRLYNRVGPLLLCRHRWTPLKRAVDEPIRRLERDGVEARSYTCVRCTAYAFGTALPVVGREMT